MLIHNIYPIKIFIFYTRDGSGGKGWGVVGMGGDLVVFATHDKIVASIPSPILYII